MNMPVRKQDHDFQLPKAGLVVGERFLRQTSGGTHVHVNPATGDAQAEVPLAGPLEVDDAVAAAKQAFPSWRSTPGGRRRDLLLRLADLIEQHSDEFAWIGAHEVGTPISAAPGATAKVLAWTRYAAGWADKLEGRVVSSLQDDSVFDFTLAEPYGVIGMIITWNGPLMGLGMKVGPALAGGNTVVIKPPECTPFTAYRFLELALEAGIPPGVINLATGGAVAGEALVTHPDVQKIAFTGGIATAQKISAAIAPLLKPALYELGGKSANLVFADADLDVAVKHAARVPLFLSGQGCVLPTRLLVEDTIADSFTGRVLDEIKSLKMGDPLDPSIDLGPVVDARAQARLIGTIERARDAGDGRLVLGGGRPGEFPRGSFVEATVFADVNPGSSLGQNECFGPVLSIMTFKTDAEAVAIANGTKFGLGAYIHSTNLPRTLKLCSQLEAGSIQVNGAPTARENAPFGGRGSSGYGREGGRDGIEEFIRVKNVAIKV